MSTRDRLEIIGPNGELAFYELDPTKGIANIGRDAENDVVIDGPGIAPFHAILHHTQKPCYLVLLTLEGETLLNGHPLLPKVPTELQNGDTIEVAGYTILLLERGDAAGSIVSAATPVASTPATATAAPLSSRADPPPASASDRPSLEFTVSELSPRQQSLHGFRPSARLNISIANTGDGEVPLRLVGEDDERACHFEFQSPDEGVNLARQIELCLPPGETISVPIRVTPPSPQFVGLGKRTYHFTITTTIRQGRQTSRSVLGQLQSAPLIGPGLLTLMTICLAVLGLFIARALIDSFSTSLQTARVTGENLEAENDLARRPAETSPAGRPEEAGEALALTYEAMFQEIAPQYGLDWQLLAQQAYRESRLDPFAVGQDYEMGLMQIMPSTWNEWAPKVGVTDPYDPYSNVLVAAAYLAFLKEYFVEKGYPEDYWMLIAYNWGPNNLRQVFENDGDWAQVPEKQRRYALLILEAMPNTPPGWDKIQDELVARTLPR